MFFPQSYIPKVEDMRNAWLDIKHVDRSLESDIVQH